MLLIAFAAESADHKC